MVVFSSLMGMRGFMASRTSLTWASTGLKGSTWMRASFMAFSIRWGGWGVLDWGLIAWWEM